MKKTRIIRTRGFKPGPQTWLVTAAVIIFGLALLIWPGQTTGFILNFIGGILMALGVFRIVRYFVRSRNEAVYNMDLGLGGALAVIGLLIFVFKGFLLSLVPTIVGVILLVVGLIKLQTALDFRRLGVVRWQFQLTIALISVVMGVVILINPFGAALLMTRMIGAAILAEGVGDLLSLRTFRDAYGVHYTHFTDK